MAAPTHLVITDSGLGGLAVCAELARAWEASGPAGDLRLTYVNAWPFEGRGYNELPDMAARAEVFDRALLKMLAWDPQRILIACNTLSIIYRHTGFARHPPVRVDGIIEAGVDLFAESLASAPGASLLLLGTKTTIQSAVHLDALVARGVDPSRIAAVECHGLAGAIEKDPDGALVAELIEGCAARVAESAAPGRSVLAGLCCTHYGYVAERLRAALAARIGATVHCLDPNARMVVGLGLTRRPEASASGVVTVEVVSKVELGEAARRGIGRLVEPVSPATAQALLCYEHVADLF